MKKSLKLTLVLPKIPDIELLAMRALEQLAEYYEIPEEKIGEARIILTEAIINAFEHSGSLREEIRVVLKAQRDKIEFTVKDYGHGFDPGMVEDPEISAKLNSSHKRGWGLKLMRSMADELSINSTARGTAITIVKRMI
ncbi:MAG: ATP-binding protein [Bacillota bacterium]